MATEQTSVSKKLVRKVHDIAGSKVITLHPDVVKALNLDNMTFLEQETQDGGVIIMRVKRLMAT